MKPINYYAAPTSWNMPKWLGILMGGAFGLMAVGSVFTAHRLVNPPAPEVVAAVPAPVPAASVTDESDDEDTTPQATRPAHATKAHRKHGVAKRSARASRPAITETKARAILAKRDARTTRRDRDQLDRLLGL